MENFNNLLF